MGERPRVPRYARVKRARLWVYTRNDFGALLRKLYITLPYTPARRRLRHHEWDPQHVLGVYGGRGGKVSVSLMTLPDTGRFAREPHGW